MTTIDTPPLDDRTPEPDDELDQEPLAAESTAEERAERVTTRRVDVERAGLVKARSALTTIGMVVGGLVFGQLVALLLDGNRVPVLVQFEAVLAAMPGAAFAVALVLVYRSARVINFVNVAFAAAGAIIFFYLHQELEVPYYLAMAAGVGLSTLLGFLFEILAVRRFFNAPRLVLTVVTIAVAQALLDLPVLIAENLLNSDSPDIPPLINPGPMESEWLADIRVESLPVPWDEPLSTVIGGDQFFFAATSLLAMTLLAVFLRFTSVGVAIRGASENADRAALFGINVAWLSTLVWTFASFLGGVAYVTQAPATGLLALPFGIGGGVLLRALAAAVLARMDNLPRAAAAAIGLGVFESSVFFATGATAIVDLVVFVFVIGGLLVQRKQLQRTQVQESGTWASTEEIRPTPPELSGLAPVLRAKRWVLLIGAVLVLGFPWVASPSQLFTGTLFCIYGIVAVSLVVLTGWGGQISLGQWGFAGVGALVSGGLSANYDVPFVPAVLLGSLIGAGVAVLLGLPALRIRGLFLAVTTVGFSVVVATVVLSEEYFGWLLPETIERPEFLFVQFSDDRAYYYLCLVFTGLTVLAALGLRNSRTGRVLIAMRDNERTAQAFGLNLVRVRLTTFALSGFMASFAGSLFVFQARALTPVDFAPDESIRMFLMAILGGLGSVVGVLLGPIYIGLTETFLASYSALAGGGGVLLVMLVLPGGLGAAAYFLRDSFLRRVAIRYKIFVPSLLADYRQDGQMARVPIAPREDADGNREHVPVRYRIPSRIGVAGSSQTGRRWRVE